MPSPSRSGRRGRTWGQRLILSINCLVVVAALAIAGALGYFNTKLAHLQRLSLGQVLSAPSGGSGAPENYLLVGTDDASRLAGNDPARAGRGGVTGARSDTIMILHVDPNESQAMILSLPRDLWVTIAGTDSKQKINAAIQLGGPTTLIKTIEDNFQIPINHYIEIDFEGFKSLVKAVDGIPIYFSAPFRDLDHTGINIEAPGCYTLGPDEALAYARARYVQYYVDGYWHSDGTADLGRISRQQAFLKRALKRSVAKGVRNPVVLNSLVDAGLQAVTVDNDLTSGDLVELGRRFRNFDPDSLQTIELPVVGGFINGQSVVTLRPEAQDVLDVFRGVKPGELSPGKVTVQVFNGTGRYNEATDVTEAFAARGFMTGPPSDAQGSTDGATLVRYAPGDEASARLVARYLESNVAYQGDSGLDAGTIEVITGTSFKQVLSTPRPAGDVIGPTTTTSTTSTTVPPSSVAPGDTAATTTVPPTVTTTTVTGFQPDQPPPGVSCG